MTMYSTFKFQFFYYVDITVKFHCMCFEIETYTMQKSSIQNCNTVAESCQKHKRNEGLCKDKKSLFIFLMIFLKKSIYQRVSTCIMHLNAFANYFFKDSI